MLILLFHLVAFEVRATVVFPPLKWKWSFLIAGNPRNVSFDAIHNTIAVSRSASDCDDESTVPVDNDCVDENGGECSTDGTSLPRRKATEEARKILLTWLVLHQSQYFAIFSLPFNLTIFGDNPYPNRRQKQDLASLTGMTLKQIVHWMSNIRKRRFMPLLRWYSTF